MKSRGGSGPSTVDVNGKGVPAYLRSLDAGYETHFQAEVMALPPGGVLLSRTLFYPTGGGQPCDQGELRTPSGDRLRVMEVEHRSGAIVHRLSPAHLGKLARGMPVEGRIDWPRRYGHMRSHTAQHLLSAMVFRHHGIPTERARLGGSGGSFDLARALPSEESLRETFDAANREFFTRSVPVSLAFVTPEEFAREPGRSSAARLPHGLAELRLVVIEGVDRTPCGGTHVRDTSEVGPVEGEPSLSLPGGGQRLRFRLGPLGSGPSVPTPPG